MKIPVKHIRTDLQVRFELTDIILTTGYKPNYKSVALLGAKYWDLAHFQKVVQMYFDRGIL